MSIDEIKKKSKLSLDEMNDNKDVGKPESKESGHPYLQPVNKTVNQKDGRMTSKVTFNMDGWLLDEFNEIYARRIIQKRKTDKSSLFCEAIKLLIEKEKKIG